MYIVEIYVIIVTHISSRNLVVPIRSSNLGGKNRAPWVDKLRVSCYARLGCNKNTQ